MFRIDTRYFSDGPRGLVGLLDSLEEWGEFPFKEDSPNTILFSLGLLWVVGVIFWVF